MGTRLKKQKRATQQQNHFHTKLCTCVDLFLNELGHVQTTPEKFKNGPIALKTHQTFSVHATREQFKNATITGHLGFVLEKDSVREIAWLLWRHLLRKSPFPKCFPSTLRLRNLKTYNNHQLIILDLCLRKTWIGKSHDHHDVIILRRNVRFQNVLRPRQNAKAAFSNSSGLKSVVKKLHFQTFQSRLEWTVDLTEGIQLHFQISPAGCGRGLTDV